MQQITFYIGENNTTHKREYSKAIPILNHYFDGYNINKSQAGFWKGTQEKCYTISIIQPDINMLKIREVQGKLKDALQQESILYTMTQIQAEF